MINYNEQDYIKNIDDLMSKIKKLETKLSENTEPPKGVWKKFLHYMRLDDDDIYDLTFYLETFTSVVTFNSRLLSSYIVGIMNEREDNGFILYEDVSCNKAENINQKIVDYLSYYGTDPVLPFRTYCIDKVQYYHIILPTDEYVKRHLNSGKTLHEIPIICLPSNSDIKLFDEEGCLFHYLEQPSYLKECLKDLVNQVIYHFGNLDNNDVIKKLLKKQNITDLYN